MRKTNNNIEKELPFVIRDVQEKKNKWNFIKGSNFAGTIEKHLKTGDITLEGYEQIFAIERKASTGELSGNLTKKQFENELIRANSLRHFYVVCEFPLSQILQFPFNSGIPKVFWKRLKVTAKYMLKRIVELECRYNVRFVFANDAETAKEYARAIMKEMIKLYGEEINTARD